MTGLRKALIVANDTYENEGLKHLQAPEADAEALAGVLGDPRIGDFQVRVVRNEPAHVIGSLIEDLFSDSRSEDVLLLHFSCHGLKSESGELFFAARNTRPNRLGSTAVSADFVQRCMRASRSRSIVLLLDCCYGGAFGQGVTVRAGGDVNVLDSFPGGRLGGGRGRAVITASSAMEYAFEGDQLADDSSRRPSVFTSALVSGLATGDADRDQDGWVSLNELYDYVFDRVREQNPHQTPSRDVEMQGELYLARRSLPVTTPAPLPRELQEVIDHPLAGVRAGAVEELARLVQGRHAGLALAATQALERLAHDDSRTVAAAAAAALPSPPAAPEAAPGPSPAVAAAGIEPAAGHTVRPVADTTPSDGAEEVEAPGSRRPPAGAPPTSPPGPTADPGTVGSSEVSRPRRRRWVYVAGTAAVLAVVGTVAAVLAGRGDPPSGGGSPVQNEFVATGPWRLVIRDDFEGSDPGCTVTLTSADGGTRQFKGIYGTKSFQVQETGSVRWEASDPRCLVVMRTGVGEAELPYVVQPSGDSDAFEAPGELTVEVLDFHGNSECSLVLRDAADGRDVDIDSVPDGGDPVVLDPGERSPVYLANLNCAVRVDTTP